MNSAAIPWTLKDENPHTAGLDDTAIPHTEIKITEIPFERNCQYVYPAIL